MMSHTMDTVRAFISAINTRNPMEIAALMTQDHAFVDSGGQVVRGREEIASGWADYFRMFPDYQIQLDSILADGNLVAAFGSASGTYNGKRGLVPENRIEMPAA